jgi:hypothetical protein
MQSIESGVTDAPSTQEDDAYRDHLVAVQEGVIEEPER